MKFLGKLAIAMAGIAVAMFFALITTPSVTPAAGDEATVIQKIEHDDGSCSLIFDAAGDEIVIDENPATCLTLTEGDTISY